MFNTVTLEDMVLVKMKKAPFGMLDVTYRDKDETVHETSIAVNHVFAWFDIFRDGKKIWVHTGQQLTLRTRNDGCNT